MLITIEGCDGFGKSTQLEMLVSFLHERKISVSSFSFPAYESSTGKLIMSWLRGNVRLVQQIVDLDEGKDRSEVLSPHDRLMFQCLQTVDKYAVAGKIRSLLALGEIVLCGRWWQSAYVYGSDDGIDPAWLLDAHACMPMADFNILLDADPATASLRMRDPDRFDRDLVKQCRLRDAYLALWRNPLPQERLIRERWIVVPADGPKEEVHSRIVEHVLPRLKLFFPSLNLHEEP